MSIAALIRAMSDAGAPPEAIALAVEAIEAAQAKDAERRARAAEKKARQRAEKAGQSRDSLGTVSGHGGDNPPKKETPPAPPKEKTTPCSEAIASSLSERDFFAEFWIAYPNREGPNPKKPARERFLRLVAKGADPEAIIAAARQLAAEHPTPTRFVPQAVTWLNQERFDDAAPVISGDEFCPEDWGSTRFLVIRFRNEHSGKDPPRAVQGGKAGYLIPAEWVTAARQRTANVGLV